MAQQLIIQGAPCPTYLLDKLLEATAAKQVVLHPPQCCQLLEITVGAAFQALMPQLLAAQLNWGVLPIGKKLADYGLVAFDMDSTLITIECIDEIANFVGRKAEISAVTEAAMLGKIDYRNSLRERLALLQGVEARVLANVYAERLLLSEGVRPFLDTIQAAGLRTAILSGGFTYFTERLRIEFGFDFATSNELEIAKGKLTGRVVGEIIDAAAKAHYLEYFADKCGLTTDKVIAIGDGSNDLQMFERAGLSVAFHAKPAVRLAADIAINFGGMDQIIEFFR